MFLSKDREIALYERDGATMDEIIELLLKNEDKPTLSQQLSEHAQHYFDLRDSYHIKTARSCIWNSGMAFYKNAMHTPSLLHKNLVIEFGGEEGVDMGALRKEFFSKFLTEMDTRHFAPLKS